MKIALVSFAALILACSPALAKSPRPKAKKTAAAVETLGQGRYSAKVAVLACHGCAPLIENAIKSVPGVESASADFEKSTLDFVVKKGAAVPMPEIQKALRAAAAEMGMGADFTLSRISRLEKKPG